jgi:hypothetical protein
MFSYRLHNPNQFSIQQDSIVVPFGHRCTSALVCKYANLRKFSLPFDWTIPAFPSRIQQVLENHFQDFIPDIHDPEILTNNLQNRYYLVLSHFNHDIPKGVEEYTRRIERFNALLQQSSKKVYFVYINEDYLYDPFYRAPDFNDQIFSEMILLEKYLKTTYPNLDFTILYFNFREHSIPPDSNILQILLETNQTFDSFYPDYAEQFRNYCGEILTHLFHTELQLGYTSDIFLG